MKKYSGTSRRGSLTVEAAIFLPIFLISLLTLGFFIRQVGTEETVYHTMLNQGRFAAISAYSGLQATADGDGGYGQEGGIEGFLPDVVGLGSRQLFRAGVEKQLEKEMDMDAQSISLKEFRYLYAAHGREHLIQATVQYRVKIPLPKAMVQEAVGECRILLRAFTGAGGSGINAEASELENDQETRLVYVFPRAGERYHSGGCSMITSVPERCVLNPSLKRKYDPCSLCNAKDLPIGSSVCRFGGYGEVYHRGGCRAVEKYVVEMEISKAQEQGYGPCGRCGG